MSLFDESENYESIFIVSYLFISIKSSYMSFHQMETSKVPVDYELITPRYSVQNIEELHQGIDHLNERGYAVFSDILTNNEINHSIDLFWKHLEGLKKPFCIRRDDPTTWDEDW